jgi:hypothetical protein
MSTAISDSREKHGFRAADDGFHYSCPMGPQNPHYCTSFDLAVTFVTCILMDEDDDVLLDLTKVLLLVIDNAGVC